MLSRLVIRNAEVDGSLCDVVIEGGVIVHVGPVASAGTGQGEVVDAGGGALIPGLHDHHVHLLSFAAAETSVRIGPGDVADERSLAEALRAEDRRLPPGQWLRAVGYHETVAGSIDCTWLDRLGIGRPMRLQHRSGALWILNSSALALLPTSESPLETTPEGAFTGRAYRADGWLRRYVPPSRLDFGSVGRRLVSESHFVV